MEPISTAVITALTLGASAGLTETAKKSVTDSYSALKSLIQNKFGQQTDVGRALNNLEAQPHSAGRQQTFAEELESARASADPELLAASEALRAMVAELVRPEQHAQMASGMGIAQADRGSSASVNWKTRPKKIND